MRYFLLPAAALFLLASAPQVAHGQDLSLEDREKVAQASAAAPAHVSAHAEIRDWDGRVLRDGTNDWVCFPSIPDSGGNDAMCLDDQWLAWADAWMSQEPVSATRVGFGYMLCGDAPASNVDPFAEGPTPDNEWLEQGMPHLMVIVPNEATLSGLPTDPQTGGPWVMWRDTPYVHIMVPMPRNPDC